MSSPVLQSYSSVQTNLWKLASAFYPLKTWGGKLNIKDDILCLLDYIKAILL